MKTSPSGSLETVVVVTGRILPIRQTSGMTSPEISTATLTGGRRWAALFFLAFGVAMIILDATVVNVAIPTMVKDLNLTTSDAEWVNAAYSLTFASLLIFFGRLADRFGRRRLFVIGALLFAVASAFVAMSGTPNALIGSRALQGIAAAMLLPASLSVINAVFTGKSRAIAFAAWGATIGGVAALGPLIGGWLTVYASWHWAFLINIPIAIIVVIGVLAVVPETRDLIDQRGIDIPGTILATLGLLGIVFALVEGQRYGWITSIGDFTLGTWTWPFSLSIVFVSAVIGVLALVLLVVVEIKRLNAGKVVVLNLRLFKIKSFGAGNTVALVVSLGEFGLLFAIPLFLQSVRGYDALQSGYILLALALGSFVASGVGAQLAQRFGPVRVLQLGMVCEVVGIIGIGVVTSMTVTGWQMAPWLFIYGAGVGFATAQLTGVILSEVPVAESGQASAVQSTSRQVGAAIGTAIIGTTLVIGLSSGVSSNLEAQNVPPAVATQVADAVSASAGQAIPALAAQPNGDVLVQGASEGFVDATKTVAWVAAAFVFLGLLSSLLLPKNAARILAEGYQPPPES